MQAWTDMQSDWFSTQYHLILQPQVTSLGLRVTKATSPALGLTGSEATPLFPGTHRHSSSPVRQIDREAMPLLLRKTSYKATPLSLWWKTQRPHLLQWARQTRRPCFVHWEVQIQKPRPLKDTRCLIHYDAYFSKLDPNEHPTFSGLRHLGVVCSAF